MVPPLDVAVAAVVVDALEIVVVADVPGIVVGFDAVVVVVGGLCESESLVASVLDARLVV